VPIVTRSVRVHMPVTVPPSALTGANARPDRPAAAFSVRSESYRPVADCRIRQPDAGTRDRHVGRPS
jgi:hypothetical protein